MEIVAVAGCVSFLPALKTFPDHHDHYEYHDHHDHHDHGNHEEVGGCTQGSRRLSDLI